jgi:hypothetical protein
MIRIKQKRAIKRQLNRAKCHDTIYEISLHLLTIKNYVPFLNV